MHRRVQMSKNMVSCDATYFRYKVPGIKSQFATQVNADADFFFPSLDLISMSRSFKYPKEAEAASAYVLHFQKVPMSSIRLDGLVR